MAVVRNSVGTRMFRNFYAKVNGKDTDIMRDGDLSCAFFVSSVLSMFDLVKSVHGTVAGTIRDLEKSGWKEARTARAGDVIVWEPMLDERGERHSHIGFALGNGLAVSNASASGVPVRHSMTFGLRNGRPKRRITAMYRAQKL
ncbi:MAG TPA: hypothetical protein VMV50_00710 [Candidatus Paceibacterota bacterium]|nr:hypothetical protein [Candidatus Paceibacterota bacterium]